jgi:predicted nucleotidyltransferase
MRAIPEPMDATKVGAIDRRLDGIETSKRVTIPWAIESGSRAWGFPSPDSDYDCRFLYVRGLGDYLSPWPRRDVIETPLDKVFDVNGWDLTKALRLLVKGNGTLTEWLRSPIVYRGDPVFCDEFLALAEQVADRALLGRHYRHVGLQHFATRRMSLKRFFYALRPAAVLHWLDANPDRTVPPMELMAALEDGDAPAEVRAASADLIALKAVTHELGDGEVPDVLARFVDAELTRAERFESAVHPDSAEARKLCETFFERVVVR